MPEQRLQKVLSQAGVASRRKDKELIVAGLVAVNGPDITELCSKSNPKRAQIYRHGRRTAPAEIKLIKRGVNPWYEVRLAEGRQNQIRVMFKHFGRLVEKLRRVKIAFLELDLPSGRYRSLTPGEVERFRKLLKLDHEKPSREKSSNAK